MLRMLRKRWVAHCLGGAALLTLAGLVQAQGILLPPGANQQIIQTQAQAPAAPSLGSPAVSTPAPAPAVSSVDALKAQVEAQQRQIQELMKMVSAMQNTGVPTSAPVAGAPAAAQGGGLTTKDVQSIINGYFAEKEAAKAAEDAAQKAEGYKVGSDLAMTATWKDGVWFSTKNKDFYFHVGGEMQYDNLFFNQQAVLSANRNVGAVVPSPKTQTGDASGGVGEMVDSTDFRRLRLWAEVGEFMFQPKLEKIQNGAIGLDEMWVGITEIPLIGTIRVGHHKTPQGLESDDWSSNRTFTYMERSTMSNAFF